ncbi:synaptotagmin-4-like [Haliotis rufescens]|uniref:synaptotagmin-4-like n=1 Tax=Haliotis rufescens TaxID=6454 RepID=UPI001EAF9657|nr:synaptotagmin-4-like [Haliotis rufescens]
METTSNISGKEISRESRYAVENHTMFENTTMSKILLTVLGVSSALGLAFLIMSCLFCIHVIRRYYKKKQKMYDVPEIIEMPDPFIASTVKEQMLGSDEPEANTYSCLDLVTQKPQIDHWPGLSVPGDVTGASHELTHVRSWEDIPSCSDDVNIGASRWKCRSYSLASLNMGIEAYNTTLHFSAEYVKERSTLTVVLQLVSSLPLKFRGRAVYAVAHLYPYRTEGLESRLTVSAESAEFKETIKFRDVSNEDLEKSTLKITLYSKKLKKSSKDAFIGQVYLKGSDVNWTPQRLLQFDMKIERKQLKRQSTSEKYLFKDMGELFVLLQYQQLANRIKVLVRKANNLPRSDKLLGNPAHYVIVNLRKDDTVIDHRETSTQSGYSPIWNQPFLFDTPRSEITDLSIEFVIMRGRRYKDGVVGHVTVGPETSGTGLSHWEEIMKPHGNEIARWHNLMPVFKFQ